MTTAELDALTRLVLKPPPFRDEGRPPAQIDYRKLHADFVAEWRAEKPSKRRSRE